MATTHISVEDASADFARLIGKARAGEEVRIDDGATTVAIMRAPLMVETPRLLSEILAGLKARNATEPADPSFAADVESAMRGHAHERLIDPWESF
jgi:antitoxin (DNA-binding transcriptional repressor) of toxin-antitoxin stability system